MKKILKIAAAVVAAALLVGGSVVCWYYRQATALPEWYAEEAAFEEDLAVEEVATDVPEPQWEDAAVDDEVEVEGEEDDDDQEDEPQTAPRTQKVMRGFHRRARGKGSSTQAVRASRATYRGGKLEAGVVLDLSRIPKEDLSDGDRNLLERATTNFPGIARRNVYVGVEDRPVTVDGVLQLGPDPKVRIGRLRYSLPNAAGKLGMSAAKLRTELDRELQRMRLTDPTQE